jgi:DASH complex subunit ASK1
MSDHRSPIKPNPPRWKPSTNPASIDVPGLDTSASVSDQIDQIEQLITLKLQVYSSLSSSTATNDTLIQNIDENFSKIHTVLTNRILPAVKRYAVATEPVREAAQVWTPFPNPITTC